MQWPELLIRLNIKRNAVRLLFFSIGRMMRRDRGRNALWQVQLIPCVNPVNHAEEEDNDTAGREGWEGGQEKRKRRREEVQKGSAVIQPVTHGDHTHHVKPADRQYPRSIPWRAPTQLSFLYNYRDIIFCFRIEFPSPAFFSPPSPSPDFCDWTVMKSLRNSYRERRKL